jgi:hypothetical protein
MVKKLKDENAPKRPLSVYFKWAQDNRQRIQKSMPVGYSLGELAKAQSKEWKEISAATKAEYEAGYAKEKETYTKLNKAYKQTANYANFQKRLKEHNVDAAKKTKFRKDENTPKKPLSAYFLWMAEQRKGLAAQGLAHKDVLKKCGELWKQVTAEDKKPYEDKAATAKKAYAVELEKYKKTDEYKQYQAEKAEFMKQRQDKIKKAKKRAREDDDDAPPKKKAKKSKKTKTKKAKKSAKSPKSKPKAPMKAAKAASE